MILTKTPVRIPIAGGIPIFTKKFTGNIILCQLINIFTYIYKRSPNTPIIQTSNLQEVKLNSKIKHK